MRLYFSSVGLMQNFGTAVELEQVPREGEVVIIDGQSVRVRHVEWFISQTDVDPGLPEQPFVYIIVGPTA